LSNQIEELQQQLIRTRVDYSKVEKALSTATDVIEQLKDKEEKLTTNIENLKARHEQDMANNRRHIAALNREKTDLSKTNEDLQSQLEYLVNASRIKKKPDVTSNDIYYDENGQAIGDLSSEIHPGVLAALQNNNLNVEETLKALNASNRMIGNLRANLQKEKSEKYELKKLLADSQEQIEAIRNAEFDVPILNKTKRKIQPKRSTNMGLSDIIESKEPSNDDEFGYQHRDGYSSEEHTIYSEEDIIDKSNRPSSDWFNTRRSNTLSRSSRSSRISSQASSLFKKRSMADESISDVEEENEDMDKTQISETSIIDEDISSEALRKLDENSSTKSRISNNVGQDIKVDESETLEDIFGSYRRESNVQGHEDEGTSANRDSKVESVIHRSDVQDSIDENTEY
ncbi:11827_t:CDS:2, partial [Dentiscutata heterogama]